MEEIINNCVLIFKGVDGTIYFKIRNENDPYQFGWYFLVPGESNMIGPFKAMTAAIECRNDRKRMISMQ